MILGVAGTKADKLIGRLLINKPGRGKFLRLIVDGEPIDIKVVKEHVYLGVKISYHKFEQATLTYRLQLANTAFRRLENVLRSKVVGPTTRLHLWKACVMSCLQHGLTSVGLQGDGGYRLRNTMIKQVRHVLRNHSTTTRRPMSQSLPGMVYVILWRYFCKPSTIEFRGKRTLPLLQVPGATAPESQFSG